MRPIPREVQLDYIVTRLSNELLQYEKFGRLREEDVKCIREIMGRVKETIEGGGGGQQEQEKEEERGDRVRVPNPIAPFYQLGVPLRAIKSSKGSELKFNRGNLLILTEKIDENFGLGYLQADKKVTGKIDLRKTELCLKYEDSVFWEVDQYAKDTPETECTSLRALAAYLTSPYKDDVISQLRSIYSWICYHIAYDVEGFFGHTINSHSNEATNVLTTRTSVCAGYSNIFLELCLASPFLPSSVDVQTIGGYGRGFGATTFMTQLPAPGSKDYLGHAWNLVTIDNRPYFMECTWGAGHIGSDNRFQPKFDGHYFLCPPEEFVCKHFPEDSSLQKLEIPLTKQEFCSLPLTPSLFFKWNGQLTSHPKSPLILESGNLLPDTLSLLLSITFFPPENVPNPFLTANLQGEGPDSHIEKKAFCQRHPSIPGQWDISVPPTEAKKSTLKIFGFKGGEGTSHGEQLIQYGVISTLTPDQVNSCPPLPQPLNPALSTNLILNSPLTSQLYLNDRYDFILTSITPTHPTELLLLDPQSQPLTLPFDPITLKYTLSTVSLNKEGDWSIATKQAHPDHPARYLYYPMFKFNVV